MRLVPGLGHVNHSWSRFGATRYAEELLALHDEMRHGAEARGEPLRQAEGMIARSHAATDDQACLVLLGFFEDVRPSGLMLTVGQPPRKNQTVFGFTLRNDEDILHPRERWKYTPDVDVLKVGQNAFGAGVAPVINKIVGVPASAVGAHLDQPRPHVTRRAMNGDAVIHRKHGPRNQVVAGKGADALVRRSVDLPASVDRQSREHQRYA